MPRASGRGCRGKLKVRVLLGKVVRPDVWGSHCWMMWLGDAEGRDRAGSDAGYKGMDFAPGLYKVGRVNIVDTDLLVIRMAVSRRRNLAAVAELQTRVTV